MTGGVMEGRCLCGEVTIRVSRHKPEVGACHCTLCRRWSGSAYFAFVAEPRDVVVEGPVRTFRSSSFAERAFCGTCGSHLWLRDDDGPYELMPGLFDDADSFPLLSVVYADRQPAYLPLEVGEGRRLTAAEYEAENPHVAGAEGCEA